MDPVCSAGDRRVIHFFRFPRMWISLESVLRSGNSKKLNYCQRLRYLLYLGLCCSVWWSSQKTIGEAVWQLYVSKSLMSPCSDLHSLFFSPLLLGQKPKSLQRPVRPIGICLAPWPFTSSLCHSHSAHLVVLPVSQAYSQPKALPRVSSTYTPGIFFA